MHDPKTVRPVLPHVVLAGLAIVSRGDVRPAHVPRPLQAIYQAHTGRQAPPATPAREAWAICGRRAGKSRIAALVAVYLACFRDHTPVLAPGEAGTLLVLAADRKQARTIMRYVRGLLDAVPLLRQSIVNQTAESLNLRPRVVIEVTTASFRSVRGYTVIACIADEVAFWRSEESMNPDLEILHAVRPAMATTKGLLPCISSPYARRGVLWSDYKDHYGQSGDVLVWQAASRDMNPEIEDATVTRALADDQFAKASQLAKYLIDVTKAFGAFYRECQVLGNGPELTEARLMLVEATRRVLARGQTLMGIPLPERM
jgi:hypothetical protein